LVDIITWNGTSFIPDDNLIMISSEDGSKTFSYPSIINWASPLAPIGTDILYIGASLVIYRATTNGVSTTYINPVTDTGITGRTKALKTDNNDNTYLFFSSGANMNVYRWNTNLELDQVFTLHFSLNTNGNGSLDTSPGDFKGIDVSRDGRYIYAVSGRSDSTADLLTSGYASKTTIYKFDLDEGPEPTPTIFAQYPYQRYLAPLLNGSTYSPYSRLTSEPFGLSVSPDGTKVAIEIKELDHETQFVVNTSNGQNITYSYLKNYLDIRDAASGALISHDFLADDFLDLSFAGTGTFPIYYPCFFYQNAASRPLEPPMVWDKFSQSVYYWLNQPQVLDHGGAGGSARVANYTCLFENSTMKKYNVWDSSFIFGSVSAFANWTPYMTIKDLLTYNAGVRKFTNDGTADWFLRSNT